MLRTAIGRTRTLREALNVTLDGMQRVIGMLSSTEQGVTNSEHLPGDRDTVMPDWHSLWMFLELQRTGSFRSAAHRLGIGFNALRKRIDELETTLGVSLLTRGVMGVQLTEEGERIVAAAKQMEAAAFNVLRARDSLSSGVEGEVRVAVTEGIGSAWLMPRLIEFQQAHPYLRIDLSCGMTSADVLRMEADLAVQLTRPQAPDLKVVRLGYLHTMPFASQSYVERHGLPSTPEEIGHHTLVFQVAEQTSTLSTYGKTLPDLARAPFVAIKTNVTSAHILAVANGAGIGWLPTYTGTLGTNLVPVDCGLCFRLDVWLTYHPDVDRIPRVRTTIDWVRSCFDLRKYPFFGEHYIHPKDLPAMTDYVPLGDLFRSSVR